MQATALIAIFLALIALSAFAAPRGASVEGFFSGADVHGQAPRLWVLVLGPVDNHHVPLARDPFCRWRDDQSAAMWFIGSSDH